MRWRAFLLALVYLLAVQVGHAEAVRNLPFTPPASAFSTFRDAANGAALDVIKFTPASGYAAALRGTAPTLGSKAFSLLKGGARMIGTGAVYQLGAIAINEALGWFYRQAQMATGTALDQAYTGAIPWTFVVSNGRCSVSNGSWTDWSSGTGVVKLYHEGEIAADYMISGAQPQVWKADFSGAGHATCTDIERQRAEKNARDYLNNRFPNSAGSWERSTDGRTYSPQLYPGDYRDWPWVFTSTAQTVADVIQSDPAAFAALRDQVMPQYMNAHPMTEQDAVQGRGPLGGTIRAPDGTTMLTVNQIYGGPVNPDLNSDTDPFTDGEEWQAGTELDDPTSFPGDLDQDGIPDWRDEDRDGDGLPNSTDPDPDKADVADLDGDGVPDASDPDIDGDNVPNASDPEPRNASIPVKCATGQKPSADGRSCVPEEEPAKCPTGYKLNEGTGKCEPDTDPADPTGDACGDFSPKRFMTHTGHYLRDVLLPCEPLGTFWSPLLEVAKGKYPFAMVNSLSNMVSAPSTGNQGAVLPAKVGPWEMDWGFITVLIASIGLMFQGYVSWVAVEMILSRFMGQVVIK